MWALPTICVIAGLVSGMAGQLGISTASSSQARFDASGAVNGNRFSVESGCAWKGRAGESNWCWRIQFAEPRSIGAILQINGDHEFVLRNAPKQSVWQTSDDGASWSDVAETRIDTERRIARIHRFRQPRRVKFLRLQISTVTGDFPVLREVEIYSRPDDSIPFPHWIIAVNTTHEFGLPGYGKEFIPLAKSCAGWENLQSQQIGLASFDEAFVAEEPRPMCAFLSGNFKDWCQVDRELWRGTQQLLKQRDLPIWASCGGAQGLAIVSEIGVDRPWDCPHCRDPQNPKVPIYGHIGHTAQRPCGDYSGCVFERGPQNVRQVRQDPAFQGLPGEFLAMESHCGQIEWAPAGWELIATAGEGTKTKVQCLRVSGAPIYAAQFHIEMDGVPETSRLIMGNFLKLAKDAGYDALPHR